MNNIVSIHQPNYIPWIGYFYKIYKSDTFIFHDDVQFSKKGMHNYHYIKTDNGSFRLKIPVIHSHGDKICTILTRDELDWKKAHLKKLKENYNKAQYFVEIYNDFQQLLLQEYSTLVDINIEIIKFICRKLEIQSQFVISSKLHLDSSKEQKIIDLVKITNGNTYYSGTGAKGYQKDETFINNEIELRYSDYQPFEYPQLNGEFESNVTIIDYLMNCGYDWGRVLENQTQNY